MDENPLKLIFFSFNKPLLELNYELSLLTIHCITTQYAHRLSKLAHEFSKLKKKAKYLFTVSFNSLSMNINKLCSFILFLISSISTKLRKIQY